MSLFNEEPLLLIPDTSSANRAQFIREAGRACNIELLFIPPGCTDRLQPLDRRVFGVLKDYARREWRTAYHQSAGVKATQSQMAQYLSAAWERLSADVIESAWSIYADESGCGDDGGSESEDHQNADYRETFDVQHIQDR
jgi:hypothetical protein